VSTLSAFFKGINEMRKHVALAICVGVVVFMAIMKYRGIATWYWAINNVGLVWLIIGTWLGKVNLNRTFGQMVKDKMDDANPSSPLARLLISGGMCLSIIAIIEYFATK
jgi:phosphate/sulfate permease